MKTVADTGEGVGWSGGWYGGLLCRWFGTGVGQSPHKARHGTRKELPIESNYTNATTLDNNHSIAASLELKEAT